ncbi:hypothetical protein Back11_44340 [Paenibacillus baekrokdamisoli]|uniref:Uncharacterized protein n=1 Tax=Paenibacillus baekrokdamisoli TaxID=1712516 RepID=A0A3G9JJ96_9BACL|nr:beta-galactosidase [Paenibacillus baekrokdamisoli]MBB3067865.1 hypothetical protein [Paenibacillus baekrokdamisoli]BBH23089.1 hypothetical protein Back11_44340 [Paenibacillus baekrokdamisoli]
MRKRFIPILVVVVSMMITSCSDKKHEEIEPDLKAFPIGMWVSPPVEQITMERYREISEAGINFIIGFREYEGGSEAIRKSLDYADANGLKVLVRDPKINALSKGELGQIKDMIAPYTSHPAYMGHVFYDEPSINQYEELSAKKAEYQKYAPNGLAYVNLFPTYASLEQKGGTYTEYVQQYFEQFKPEVLSYDHYPFLTETKDASGGITEDYFYNLEQIRTAAVEHNVPFWLFIQTLSFNLSHRDPTEEEIRWQVYTSLAYGAKGIQYFTYWTPESGRETFGSGMIDLEGNKTKHYEEVKRLNKEVQDIGSRLLDLKSEGVIHYGSEPPLIENPMQAFEPIASISGDPAIIGCFSTENGRRSVLVVNSSYRESGTTSLQLKSEVKKVTLWKNGALEDKEVTGGKVELQLLPGQGVWLEFRE